MSEESVWCKDTPSNKGNYTEGYMCMTDYVHELGIACGGNVVYPSVEDLREHRKCVEECGIVKVRIQCVEVIQESRS